MCVSTAKNGNSINDDFLNVVKYCQVYIIFIKHFEKAISSIALLKEGRQTFLNYNELIKLLLFA